MPLKHIKFLESKNDFIYMDKWHNLSNSDKNELNSFINRSIIEYYLNVVNEKRIIKLINNDILILRKKIDWSVFNYGWTLPKERHKIIYLIIEEELSRGESRNISVEFNGNTFELKFRSVDRQTKTDTLQIRYDNNKRFIENLKEVFKDSFTTLSEEENHKSDKLSEYLLFLYNNSSDKYKVIPSKLEADVKQKFWWVNQGKTYKQEIENNCIWAPLTNVKGRTFFHWENVSKVKSEDIILHYKDGEIFAFSIARSDAYKENKPFESNRWEKMGWKVDLDYNFFEDPIPLEKFSREIYNGNKKYFPISSNFGVNQGYLYELAKKDFELIIRKLESSKDINNISNKINNFNIRGLNPVNEKLDYLSLSKDIKNSGLYFSDEIICRFLSSLCTKRFLILTGLSGSGKTKLAQAFVKWISSDSDQYSIVTVGSDWTNREPLLGYPNAIEKGKYVKPHHGVVDLLIKASKNPDMPYFLVLDEMNLSHVERYFADFLSAMESNEAIQFHEGGVEDLWESDTGLKVPGKIRMPDNLFIIGTVNIDETTYMFSPKVLDRANVIEFRVDIDDIDAFLDNPVKPNLKPLEGSGASAARDFVQKATNNNQFHDGQVELKNILIEFFSKLKFVGAEFGYRTASEIMTLAANIKEFTKEFTKEQNESWPLEKITDAAILQKLLPKLHGSRKKLSPVLEDLAELCIDTDKELNIQNILTNRDELEDINVKFPKSLEKISRMYKRLMQNGFTSFTEA